MLVNMIFHLLLTFNHTLCYLPIVSTSYGLSLLITDNSESSECEWKGCCSSFGIVCWMPKWPQLPNGLENFCNRFYHAWREMSLAVQIERKEVMQQWRKTMKLWMVKSSRGISWLSLVNISKTEAKTQRKPVVILTNYEYFI